MPYNDIKLYADILTQDVDCSLYHKLTLSVPQSSYSEPFNNINKLNMHIDEFSSYRGTKLYIPPLRSFFISNGILSNAIMTRIDIM